MTEFLRSPAMLRQLQTSFRASLQEFAATPSSTFRVLYSVPQLNRPSAELDARPNTLYVLDSSFNPPSRAHMLITEKAFQRDIGKEPKRILFLLATENADKKPKPASFEDRLVMMTLMAQDLHTRLGKADSTVNAENVAIDIGVTKKPYFKDKAASVDESGIYGDAAQQVHLTGYDTLIRIFDAKYYPEGEKLGVLQAFLKKHRLRVCYRVGDSYAGRVEQDEYVQKIGDGSREQEGVRPEWQDRIELVNDAQGEGEGVSSTEARKAAGSEEWNHLKNFVGEEIAKYIESQELYSASGK